MDLTRVRRIIVLCLEVTSLLLSFMLSATVSVSFMPGLIYSKDVSYNRGDTVLKIRSYKFTVLAVLFTTSTLLFSESSLVQLFWLAN